MYAVIRTGGKQYRVEEGERLEVERLAADDGSEVELTPVLVVDGDDRARHADPARRRHASRPRVVGATRGPEDQRLHLQAEEQQPPPLRPPPGPAVIEITSIIEGRSRPAKTTTASRPQPSSEEGADVEEEGRGVVAQRSRLQRAAARA